MIFAAGFGAVAVVVGAVAALTGFGIGSVLTPLAASQLGMSLAVAVVALPHFVGTTFRAWRMRGDFSPSPGEQVAFFWPMAQGWRLPTGESRGIGDHQ